MALVSVIIPTYQRPRLCRRAVESVLAQTYAAHEILVVIDGIDDGTRAAIEALHDSRSRVVETGVNNGPAAARNFGMLQATGDYVAILDDDDEWASDKLEQQMRFIEAHGLERQEFLLSCRTITKCHSTGKTQVWPVNMYKAGDDLSEYLFDRRHPFRRAGLVASGTLLFPRALAERVPFPHDEVHEDWSWLLLCVARDHVPLMMCEGAMFIYNMNHELSRNLTTDWHESLRWGLRYRSLMSGRAFAGLVSSTTAWRAKRQDGIHAFRELARVMRREGQPSIMHWLTLIAVMVFPPAIAEKMRQHSYAPRVALIRPKTPGSIDMTTCAPLQSYILKKPDHV